MTIVPSVNPSISLLSYPSLRLHRIPSSLPPGLPSYIPSVDPSLVPRQLPNSLPSIAPGARYHQMILAPLFHMIHHSEENSNSPRPLNLIVLGL